MKRNKDFTLFNLPSTVQLPSKNPPRTSISSNKSDTFTLRPPLFPLHACTLQGQHKHIFALQYIYGLRSCEALELKNRHIYSSGIIYIEPRKQSRARFIWYPFVLPLYNPDPLKADQFIFSISYRAYYTQLSRHNLFVKKSGRRKYNIVTHVNRHIIFEQLKNHFDLSPEQVQLFSGHSSLSGLNYYLGNNSFSTPIINAHLNNLSER